MWEVEILSTKHYIDCSPDEFSGFSFNLLFSLLKKKKSKQIPQQYTNKTQGLKNVPCYIE